MKFRCQRDALAEAVGTAYRAVASRTGALPVLSGIKVTLSPGQVEFTGSDLELTIRVRVPAEVEGEGSAVLVARLLVDTLAKLSSDTVSVEIGEEQAKIEAGRFRSEVRTLAASDFPRLHETEGDAVRVAGGPLAEGLRQVVPAASKDDARPILTGVLITATGDGVRLVATDSYRLAVRDLPGVTLLPEGQKVLVGAKGLGELQRLLGSSDVDVYLGDRHVTFKLETTELTARLIEGDFPNYQQLIPSGYPNKMTVERDSFTAAVERVSLVGGTSRDSAPIRLAMSNDGLELSATAQDVGQSFEPVEAKFEGTDVTVAFNSRFLLDGVEAAASPELTIESIDPLKPAVLRGKDADFLYLLMPVRIA
ncbi:MAG TPA: DNA polymerase III subunit beta [Acidimicrobiia bacterium]|nr:DNA polymerase III subunit beta [Acidimicrobiia bacterium]